MSARLVGHPTYSPNPMSAYALTSLPTCEVQAINQIPRSAAVWNLYWLSVPSIDGVIEQPQRWWQVHTPRPRALASIVKDVMEDEALYRKLVMHPTHFLEWFERQDHTIFDTHNVLGDDWAETVLIRAAAAATRLANDFKPLRTIDWGSE